MNSAVLTISMLLASQIFAEDPASAPLQPTPPAVDSAPAPRADLRGTKSVLKANHQVEQPAATSSDAPLVPVKSAQERGAAPDILHQALAQPAEGGFTGRQYSLLEVLARTPDRNQQILMTRAYWKLSVATAEYQFAIDENRRLEALADDSPVGGRLLQAAKTAASARVREAEVAAMQAQQGLADLLFIPAGEPLPITVDVPHVGPYRTYFETLFAGRIPPGRAHLIHRALPIRRESVELRAAAVQSALEATDAAGEALAQRSADIRLALAAHDALRSERRAFLASVWEYNNDIAEYALSVAQIGTSEAMLVSMMIKTPQSPQPNDRREPTPAVPLEGLDQSTAEPGKLRWVPAPGATESAIGNQRSAAPNSLRSLEPSNPFSPPAQAGSVVKQPMTGEPTPAKANQPNP